MIFSSLFTVAGADGSELALGVVTTKSCDFWLWVHLFWWRRSTAYFSNKNQQTRCGKYDTALWNAAGKESTSVPCWERYCTIHYTKSGIFCCY